MGENKRKDGRNKVIGLQNRINKIKYRCQQININRGSWLLIDLLDSVDKVSWERYLKYSFLKKTRRLNWKRERIEISKTCLFLRSAKWRGKHIEVRIREQNCKLASQEKKKKDLQKHSCLDISWQTSSAKRQWTTDSGLAKYTEVDEILRLRFSLVLVLVKESLQRIWKWKDPCKKVDL